MIDLTHVNDQLLAYGLLKNDLLFHKIPKDQYLYYINGSIKIGKAKAQEFKNCQIEQLCQKNNIEISYADQNGKFYGVQFRAHIELGQKTRKITLYKSSLDEMTTASQRLFNSHMTFDEVVLIHLAHELFHFYEYIEKKPTNERLNSIVRLRMGPLQLHSTLMSSCEIAAHAFAKELLNLDYLPNIYDYILLIDREEWTIEQFHNLIEQWKNELGDREC